MPKRTLYIHIHGTTGIGNHGTAFFKTVNGMILAPDLFTTGTDENLIPITTKNLGDGTVPSGVKNFEEIYESFTKDTDRYYFQWSGNLSEAARKKAGRYLAEQIKELTKDDDDVEVIMVCHSHGGSIARHTAEQLVPDDRIKFHMITDAMPLCNDPPQIMSEVNVLSWQQFYNPGDINAYIGSKLMQNGGDVYRTIEEIAKEVKKDYPDFELPADWKSHLLTVGGVDKHNGSMRSPATDDVCRIVVPVLQKYLTTLFRDVPEADAETVESIKPGQK